MFKLFISGMHPSNILQGLTHPEHDRQRRDTFSAECDAYDIAMANPGIRRHVPDFFGRVEISDVLDENGISMAMNYLLDCCYSIEYVNGNEMKLGFYAEESCPPHVVELLRQMKTAGIS